MSDGAFCFFKPIESIKSAASYYTPKIVKDNLATALSVFGDPMMSVPLVVTTLSTTVDSLLFSDDASEGSSSESDIFYWYIFAALVFLLYPGQALIAHKKNETTVNDLFNEDVGRKDEGNDAAKSIMRSFAICTVSVSGGAASYLLANAFRYSNKEVSIGYGVFVMAINVLFRQLFFNFKEDYTEPKYASGSVKKHAVSCFCTGLSILYSLTSATPFAAAYIFKSESNIEFAVLMLMLSNMTAGEYIRMDPSLKNYLGVLADNKIKLNKVEEIICITGAAIRTGLTMASVSEYPAAVKSAIWGILTPGVGLFQVAACKPPKEFARDIGNDDENIEMLEIEYEETAQYSGTEDFRL